MAIPHVHVIDDDAAVRDSLALLLEAEGLAVTTYATAQAFLARVAADFHGCVLADVHMEGMDGFDLLAGLKARGVEPPVVLMTGRPSPDLAARADRAGAVAVIDKPFRPEDLLAALRDAVARLG